MHTAEAGYSCNREEIFGGESLVWMLICKLTEKSLRPVVNRIWVRVGTIIVKVQYLQLTINVESIPPQACRQMFPSLSLLFFLGGGVS